MRPGEAFKVCCHDTGWTIVIPNPRGPSVVHAFLTAESLAGWVTATLNSKMPAMPLPPVGDIDDINDGEEF